MSALCFSVPTGAASKVGVRFILVHSHGMSPFPEIRPTLLLDGRPKPESVCLVLSWKCGAGGFRDRLKAAGLFEKLGQQQYQHMPTAEVIDIESCMKGFQLGRLLLSSLLPLLCPPSIGCKEALDRAHPRWQQLQHGGSKV